MSVDMDKRIAKSVEDEKSKELARLRDEFAMAALMACRNHSNEQWLAERAYKIADAMLKARDRK